MLNYPCTLQRPVESMYVKKYIFDEAVNPYSVLVTCPSLKLIDEIDVGKKSFSADLLEEIARAMATSPHSMAIRSVFRPRVVFGADETIGCSSVDEGLRSEQKNNAGRDVSISEVEFLAETTAKITCVRQDNKALLVVSGATLRIRLSVYDLKHFTMTSSGHFYFQGFPPLRTLSHLGQ